MVLGGSVFCGINYAIRLRKRRDNLKALERIVMYLESEIRYRHSVMSEAFVNAAKKADKPFSDWLYYLGLRLKDEYNGSDFYKIWCDSLNMLQDDTFLSKEDIEELMSLGQTLGYLDIEAHRAGIELEIDNIHNRINDINEGLKDRMRVSVVAGAVFGILVVMILV